MRPIDGDKLRARVCEIFLCAEPSSAEERRFALVLGLIDSEPTIAPPPNDPLTMEELREMVGEHVWVKLPNRRLRSAIVSSFGGAPMESELLLIFGINNYVPASTFISNGSRIYRRRPEGD